MIDREIEEELRTLQNEFPIIAILGPRQSGKTTLSKKVFSTYEYISLEDIDHREFAQNDPRGFLSRYKSNVIFDEIQRVPELMSYLQTHADAQKRNGKIVITGSHNFLLMEQISQSLAGRVGITKLLPFTVDEIREKSKSLNEVLFSGMFPRIYDQHIRPETFYKNYISSYIEKDVRQIKKITNLDNFMKFMRIIAGRTGQELNLSVISEECGISHNTVKEWISILEASFIIYKMRPYHKNYNKRIVKNPKIYFTDTGLVCNLLGIRKDLIVDFGKEHYGIEIKSSKTVQEKYFDSLKYWTKLSGDKSSSLFLVYGGNDNTIRNKMNVVSWKSIKEKIIMNAI